MKRYLTSTTHPQLACMTTSPAQRFLNRRTKTEIPMKATLLTPELADKVFGEKANKTKKSQGYYDRTAKDLNELKPGTMVRINSDGLAKGQKWRKRDVIQSHGHWSYSVKVDEKFLEGTVHIPNQINKPSRQTRTSQSKKLQFLLRSPAKTSVPQSRIKDYQSS